MRTHSKEFQQSLTPQKALDVLREGNNRFVNNLQKDHDHLQVLNETKNSQHPFAAILSCIDSRTAAELIFDQGLGDILSIRIAGNILNKDILGSMEFACKVAGVKILFVLGHTKCGAVEGAYAGLEMGHLTGLLEKLKPAVQISKQQEDYALLSRENQVDRVAKNNVLSILNRITERSPILEEMYKSGEIGISGGMYNVDTGVVEFYPH